MSFWVELRRRNVFKAAHAAWAWLIPVPELSLPPLAPVLGSIVLFFCLSVGWTQEQPPVTTGPVALDPHALVVLPFEARGSDPRASLLAEAAYEELLVHLSTIDGLHVVDPRSVAPFEGSDLSPEEIARQLGGGHALKGTTWVGETSFSLEVTCIHAATGEASCAPGMSVRRGDGGPVRVDPDKFLPEAIPSVIEGIVYAVFPERVPEAAAPTALEAIFLDINRTDRERLEAFGELARLVILADSPTGSSGANLSDTVVVAAVQLAVELEDQDRRDVWSRLAGIENPYLIQPLLHVLRSDANEDVRAVAAIGLRKFLEEPGVRGALQDAIDNDVSAEVQSEAHWALLTTGLDVNAIEALQAIALDTSLREGVRLRALRRLRYSEQLRTEAVVSAMVEMAKNSADPQVRADVWRQMSGARDPQLIEPLLEALSSDPDADVREEAAETLGDFLDEPGVIDARRDAQDKDPAAGVRNQIQLSIDQEG